MYLLFNNFYAIINLYGNVFPTSEARDEVKNMSEKREIVAAVYSGERPLFGEHDLIIKDTIFDVGESPLKESKNIELYGSMFKWKYPLWYTKNVTGTVTELIRLANEGGGKDNITAVLIKL